MSDDTYKETLARIESQITDIDGHIDSLKLALKDAKKQREEKVSELRGTIRDQGRGLLRLSLDEQTGALEHAEV